MTPDQNIIDVRAWIDRQKGYDIRLKDVIAISGYTSGHFKRRFAALIGMGAGTYLRKRRLERAKQLIDSGHRDPLNFSHLCGYDHPDSLRRAFLKEYGMTIFEYANRHRL